MSPGRAVIEMLNYPFKILSLKIIEIQMADLKHTTKDNCRMSLKCWDVIEVSFDFSFARYAGFRGILLIFT